MANTNNTDHIPRSFSEILKELRAGECLHDLTEVLNKVTAASIETGKSGTVTLKLKVKPEGVSQAIVSDEIDAKIPQHSVQPTIMFVDDDRNLTRRNPRQMSFDSLINVVPEPPVNVDPETGEIVDIDKE